MQNYSISVLLIGLNRHFFSIFDRAMRHPPRVLFRAEAIKVQSENVSLLVISVMTFFAGEGVFYLQKDTDLKHKN